MIIDLTVANKQYLVDMFQTVGDEVMHIRNCLIWHLIYNNINTTSDVV